MTVGVTQTGGRGQPVLSGKGGISAGLGMTIPRYKCARFGAWRARACTQP
jgi:hypothetical protein